METKFRLSSLIPAGLIVERSDERNGVIIVSARAAADRRSCPLCSGVDDWAFHRNHRYGTVVCDLEKRRIIKLLPDREIATASTFLAQHPKLRLFPATEAAAIVKLPLRHYQITTCHSGRRSLAFDGESQRSIPRSRAQIHASNPGRNLCYDDQS
ncbi:transposase [Rhizobium leguminosarum]|uniref:transposase n=1 Tax=Rhizobium leguminosarum TaxID=384 RepID=UPI0021BBBB87|nr:transposase [Rhizobium leguminosarum]